MTDALRVMLLIDADNVSADVIEQAVQMTMAEYGAIHVRRAYCNAEMALKQQALFKRLAVRPMVNLSTGKNSTDIALAVDALDLVVAERPQVVVLVSSDSDFAPLVIRLREKGCRVCGIGQHGKTGDETVAVYDQFTDLHHHGVPHAAAPVAKRSPAVREAPPPGNAAAKAPVKRAASRSKPAAGATAAAAAPATSASRAATPRTAGLPDEVKHILDCLPELRAGAQMELNQAVELLRTGKLLSKSASSLKLFKKYPALFALSPDKQPSKVRYIGRLPV